MHSISFACPFIYDISINYIPPNKCMAIFGQCHLCVTQKCSRLHNSFILFKQYYFSLCVSCIWNHIQFCRKPKTRHNDIHDFYDACKSNKNYFQLILPAMVVVRALYDYFSLSPSLLFSLHFSLLNYLNFFHFAEELNSCGAGNTCSLFNFYYDI